MIYLLIPARDEARTVGVLLWKIRRVFTAFPREYQLLVADDGSADETAEVLAPYARALPLTVVTHRPARGYARSLEALIRLALQRTDRPRRDIAVTMQADFSDSPDELPELVKRIEGGADIALSDTRSRPGLPWTARAARRLVATVARALLRVPESADPTGTLRAYRLSTLERLVREAGSGPLIRSEGRVADIELLARVSRHARTLACVPASVAAGERSRPRRNPTLRSTWRAILALPALGAMARAPVVAAPSSEQSRRSDRPPGPRRRGGRGGRPTRPAPPAPTPTPFPS